MASLGHLAVGVAAAQAYRQPTGRRAPVTAMIFWSALSFLPDLDVIGFALGVRYEDEWGHRGATHSFVFSLALGAAVGVLAPRFRRPAVRTGVIATLVLASHAVLDTLTNGGLGCALFWPFDRTRYFAPWTPIPVAPIGLGFLSPYGLFVAATELVLFAPLLWVVLRPRTGTAARAATWRRRLTVLLVAIWAAALWLLMSGDPVRERVIRVLLRDSTEFTPAFSEERLNAVARGDTAREVRTLLGPPFHEFLLYDSPRDGCSVVRVDNAAVTLAQAADACHARGIAPGTARAALEQALGPARETCWVYSRPPGGGYFRVRAVCFGGDRVTAVVRRWVRE